VSGPRRSRSSRLTRRLKRSTSKGSHWSAGLARLDADDRFLRAMVLTSATRLMPSACLSAARDRFTRPRLLRGLHGARLELQRRSVCTQAKTPPASRMASRKKVRQKRLSANGGCVPMAI
jgi:hypothetical protein